MGPRDQDDEEQDDDFAQFRSPEGDQIAQTLKSNPNPNSYPKPNLDPKPSRSQSQHHLLMSHAGAWTHHEHGESAESTEVTLTQILTRSAASHSVSHAPPSDEHHLHTQPPPVMNITFTRRPPQ